MQFDYEISIDEYAAAQVLYHTAHDKNRLVKRGLLWVFVGLFFVFVVVTQQVVKWGPILLLLTGGWSICAGFVSVFPARYFRRAYPQPELSGKTYHAELNEDGFSVSGDSCSWRVLWSEVRVTGENKRVFIFSAKGSIFMFGKKYLTDEQQIEIRQFLASRAGRNG